MMKYGYAWEKLYTAVKTLAASEERIQDRLAAAWLHSGVRLSNPVAQYLPDDLQPEFEAIHAALTKVSDPDRGAIAATCAAMSDDEASDLAERIVTLYDAV
ncbi:MAG TPA: hypothetical protein PKA58_18820, partial [Polyangium sp.]|nr:hypothetical protein [Polyangium sp.]